MTLSTLADLVFHLREQWGGHPRLFVAHRGERREPTTASDLVGSIHALALALEDHGLVAGERLALYSDAAPEWHVVDLACLLSGIVTVPVHPGLPVEQVAFILRNSGASWVAFGGAQRLALEALLPTLGPRPRLLALDDQAQPAPCLALTRLLGQGAARVSEIPLERLRHRVRPESTASLSYTGGATGLPKGVILSHGNLAAACVALAEALPFSPEDRFLATQPTTAPLARTLCQASLWQGTTVHFVEAGLETSTALEQSHATAMVLPAGELRAVEWRAKTYLSQLPPRQRRALESRFAAWLSAGETRTASRREVALRRALGCHDLRWAVAAYAPPPPAGVAWLRCAGVEVLLGYGLCEATSLVTLDRPQSWRLDALGRPLADTKLHLDRHGEISVRGPQIATGYWHQPAASAETFAVDGWLRTGDLGQIDRDGFLHVQARRSSLITLADGRSLAPHPIEVLLQSQAAIQQAVVVGDGAPFLGALLVPSPATDDGEEPWARLEAAVSEVNRQLPENQRIGRFQILPAPLTVAGGDLTPNLQLRRRRIHERYAETIAALFLDAGLGEA